jgi:hypothetical protein
MTERLPKYAGALYGTDADGFKALLIGLNKASQQHYAPLYFSVTPEGKFAVILEHREPAPETPDQGKSKGVYPRFFEE